MGQPLTPVTDNTCEDNLINVIIPYQYSGGGLDATQNQNDARSEMSNIIDRMMYITSQDCSISNYTENHTFFTTISDKGINEAQAELSICAQCNLTTAILAKNFVAALSPDFTTTMEEGSTTETVPNEATIGI